MQSYGVGRLDHAYNGNMCFRISGYRRSLVSMLSTIRTDYIFDYSQIYVPVYFGDDVQTDLTGFGMSQGYHTCHNTWHLGLEHT